MKSAVVINNKVSVSSKGQIVIPKALREELGIHAGHELLFTVRPYDRVIEIKTLDRSIDMFFDRCKRKNAKPMSIKEMDEAIMHAVSENDNSGAA